MCQEEAGIFAAQEAARIVGNQGKIAVVIGDQKLSSNRIRYESFVNYLKKHCPDVTIADKIQVESQAQAMYDKMISYLKQHSDVNVIYCTVGMQLEIAKAIEDSHLCGKVHAIVFPISDSHDNTLYYPLQRFQNAHHMIAEQKSH